MRIGGVKRNTQGTVPRYVDAMETNWVLGAVGLLALVPVALYVADTGGWFVALTALNVLIIAASFTWIFGAPDDAAPA